jgi:hypothetical protein
MDFLIQAVGIVCIELSVVTYLRFTSCHKLRGLRQLKTLCSVNNELQRKWKEAVLLHLITIPTFAWTDERKYEHLSQFSLIEPRISLLRAVLLLIQPHSVVHGSVIVGSSTCSCR